MFAANSFRNQRESTENKLPTLAVPLGCFRKESSKDWLECKRLKNPYTQGKSGAVPERMNKAAKQFNLEQGAEALEVLVAWDFRVQQFEETHFRINDRLDVWPSTKKFFDLKIKQTGSYSDLEKFVRKHLR